MAAATHHSVTVEEYLTSPGFDRFEYEAGVVIEKRMPDWKHSRLCGWIIALVLKFYPEYVAGPEVRARLRQDRWMLPDVTVALLEQVKREEYATAPPHLCVEVVSKEDTLEQIAAKCAQYHEWGVPHCWILDPENRTAWQYDREDQLHRTFDLLLAEPIELSGSCCIFVSRR